MDQEAFMLQQQQTQMMQNMMRMFNEDPEPVKIYAAPVLDDGAVLRPTISYEQLPDIFGPP